MPGESPFPRPKERDASLLEDFPGDDAYQVAPSSVVLRLPVFCCVFDFFILVWADSCLHFVRLPTLPFQQISGRERQLSDRKVCGDLRHPLQTLQCPATPEAAGPWLGSVGTAMPLCLGKKVHEASWSREAFHDFHPHDLEHDGEASPRHPEVSCLCFDACACVVCFVARPTTPSSLPRRLQSEMGRAQPVAPCILCVVCRVRGHRALCRPPHGETRPIQSHPRGPCLQS